MNNERVKVLVNIFLDRLDDMMNSEHDPRNLWEAVSCCVKHWDPDSEDFAGMFRSSMEKAAPFIEEGEGKPVEGIYYLCANGKSEEVRSAFIRLSSPDGGDINARQDRIIHFSEEINSLLNELVPAQWQYKQRTRNVVRYLAFIRPQENFFYNAAEGAAFAGYTEVTEEIGYDRFLKLTGYYRMGEDLTEYLLTRDDLAARLLKELEKKSNEVGDRDLPHIDPGMHIMAYALIRGAYRNGFYEEKAANRKSKISSVSQRKIEKTQQQARLLDEQERISYRLDEIITQEMNIQIPLLSGVSVRHDSFGEGCVMDQNGKYLTIDFDGIQKKFALPGAIIGGHLQFDNDDFVEQCFTMEKIGRKKKEITSELTAIEVQLQMLD